MDKLNGVRKKNKNNKVILSFYKKLSALSSHLEFLFKNKFILQEFYIEKMILLNEINLRIISFEQHLEKKKITKQMTDKLNSEIKDALENLCNKIGSINCLNTIDIYIPIDDFLDDKDIEYKKYLNMFNNYFVPLSSALVNDTEKFIKKYNISNINLPEIIKIIEFSKSNPLIERINGATLIFFINKSKILYINGYFNKDPLNLFKNSEEFNYKTKEIESKMEYIDVPINFKEKYIEQLSLKDFLINNSTEIVTMVKEDYQEFLSYKNKSLSLLIKEFMKANIEKQRKIIILFLISDQESQFTAHIIFDLMSDKTFLYESQYLSDILFESLHWKVQKIFKVSREHIDLDKKKLENLSINNVPYDTRINALNISDNIKLKAFEKLKEINGSKENSVKAQQWLDGFLKIPFNIIKKEPLIDFFSNFQKKIDNYISIFTIKISEFNYDLLNEQNKYIYNQIIQIIDEYHSILNKSENSFSNLMKYFENVKINIKNELEKNIIKIFPKIETSSETENIKIQTIDENLFLLDNFENNEILIDQIITNNIIPSEEVVNDCMNQLKYFKKIKNELYENNIINKNNISIMIKKLSEFECMLNLNLIKNEPENNEMDENNINIYFIEYILYNIKELDNYINEWNKFKIDKKNYMQKVDNILDKCTYGQTQAKNQMKRIIGQWMNGVSKGQCFGLCGPPGVGKTTLCKNGLAKCLFDENDNSRPFAFLPLGGATNGSILEGHHYTYLGSTWGKIVDILMETKCINPIIYIDELDKISKTEHGREIISILTHITDQSQNKEFYDRYFSSIPIDLSQVLFIFSYNDKDSIDRILRDRIQEINIKPLSVKEKLMISQNYIIPDILNDVGFSNNEIIFLDKILIKIINEYTYEAGLRKLNEILYDIIREINLKKIEDNIDIIYPYEINEELILDLLSNIPKITIKKINEIPKVGYVNGLYASSYGGLGGISPINVVYTYSDKKFGIEKTTGCLGNVLKESIELAYTIAINILPNNIREDIFEKKLSNSLHIHFGDGSTEKDGPSGGGALCVAIISRLINIPIYNNVAVTGEIQLTGTIHEIGGLYAKICGAYESGIKKILIPLENKKDLDLIFKKEEEDNKNIFKFNKLKAKENILLIEDEIKDQNKIMFRNEVEIVLVDNIYELLNHCLIKNEIKFNIL
jgi:ATP-dependent Lon protease